ncbi:MAG: DUF3017 domain-containing protein [Nocardioides marinisabuli]|uniref:DUF3017 domain-containing protein n=1 Tax=Nocardioides marinisabuli TaxID=419476 RepID=UPI003219789F
MSDPAGGTDPEEPSYDAAEQPTSVEEIAEEIAEEEGRRYPSTLGGLIYLGVLAAGAVGIVLAGRDDWRLGVSVLAGALMAAAAARLVLPARDAGMLAVRHRLVDVALLGGVGGLLLFLARTIPNQPGL